MFQSIMYCPRNISKEAKLCVDQETISPHTNTPNQKKLLAAVKGKPTEFFPGGGARGVPVL